MKEAPDFYTPIKYVLASLLVVFVVYKAYTLPFTWDEDYTLYQFIVKGNLFHQQMELMSANNHLLNTWLTAIMYYMFGTNPLALRLPNVLAFIVYCVYSFRLTNATGNKGLGIVFFSLLIFNPFLLDFFSLSRGYGLSIAFMMASIYYLKAYLASKQTNKLLVSVAMVLFSSLVNLSLLYLLPLYLYFLLREIPKYRTYSLNQFFLLFVITILLLYELFTLLSLHNAGALFYGGMNGVWQDTVNSLIFSYLYNASYSFSAHYLVKACLTLLVVVAIYHMIKTKRIFLKEFSGSLFIILLFSLLLQIVAHSLFEVKYLIGRTALMYVPLTVILANELLGLVAKSRLIRSLSWGLMALCLIHFVATFDLSKVLLWS